MTDPKTPPADHNGGPALSEPPLAAGRCKHCRHWKPPPEQDQQAYERFSLGLARRRVRLPTGSCDRVSVGSHKVPGFAATSADFGCANFEGRAVPPRPVGAGYVTVSENGRIVWEGSEEELPSARPPALRMIVIDGTRMRCCRDSASAPAREEEGGWAAS